jgi:hypothetical protein
MHAKWEFFSVDNLPRCYLSLARGKLIHIPNELSTKECQFSTFVEIEAPKKTR